MEGTVARLTIVGVCLFSWSVGACSSPSEDDEGGDAVSDTAVEDVGTEADTASPTDTESSPETDISGEDTEGGEGECTSSSYEEDCPTRSCRVATGCTDDGQCEYAPLRCGGEVCECPDGECADDELIPCGESACGGMFCDPSPVDTPGGTAWGNACVEPPTDSCGTCELGVTGCESAEIVCDDPIAQVPPRGELAQLECDSTSVNSSFVFVDPGFDGSEADGSREAPYGDLSTALAEAGQSTAVGVVIGGSPTFDGHIVFEDGVSVYGGFENFPSFKANDAHRPTIEADVESAEDDVVVGASATDIESRTVLTGLEIRTTDVASEKDHSSYGLYAANAPGLILDDVRIVTGSAAAGSAGEGGRNGRDGGDGGDGADGQVFPSPVSFPGGPGGQTGEGAGCRFSTETDAGPGGRGGLGSSGSSNPGHDAPGGGASGGVESDGDDATCCNFQGAYGADADPAELDVSVDGMPVPTGGRGEDGKPGRPGHGGGGGASGQGNVTTYHHLGGSGGGGGAGGCGGEGGEAGYPGGWSIGVLAVDSSGLTVRDVEIRSGDAGNGGSSGSGGRGGSGGVGGEGGAGASSQAEDGFDGGDGGHGQEGGSGGLAAGGSTYGIWCDEPTAISLDGADDNVIASGEAGDGASYYRARESGPDGEAADMHNCE